MNSLVCLIYADIVCSFQGYTLLNCVKWRWNWSFVQKETMYQWTKKSEIVRKETFHQHLCFAFFIKGLRNTGISWGLSKTWWKKRRWISKWYTKAPVPVLKVFLAELLSISNVPFSDHNTWNKQPLYLCSIRHGLLTWHNLPRPLLFPFLNLESQ